MQPTTVASRSPGDLFGDFLDLHDQCVAAGLLDAAYQALAGGLSCAEAASSLRSVSLVVELAQLRQQRLDREVPRHPLSSSAAQQRGQLPLFGSLAHDALAIKARLEQGGPESGSQSHQAEGA
jgi:hypothetical protein